MGNDESGDPFIRLYVKKNGRVQELGWAYPSESKAISDGEQNRDVQGAPHHVTTNGTIVHTFPGYDPNAVVYPFEERDEDD